MTKKKNRKLNKTINEEKEIKIAFFRKNGNLPAGVYIFESPNIWRPVIYFRKAKSASRSEFERVLEYMFTK